MAAYVPVADGEKIPFAVTSGVPDQVPPAGVPTNVMVPLFWQTVVSLPALTIGGAITVTTRLSILLHAPMPAE